VNRSRSVRACDPYARSASCPSKAERSGFFRGVAPAPGTRAGWPGDPPCSTAPAVSPPVDAAASEERQQRKKRVSGIRRGAQPRTRWLDCPKRRNRDRFDTSLKCLTCSLLLETLRLPSAIAWKPDFSSDKQKTLTSLERWSMNFRRCGGSLHVESKCICTHAITVAAAAASHAGKRVGSGGRVRGRSNLTAVAV
jgi:hypothetical protein